MPRPSVLPSPQTRPIHHSKPFPKTLDVYHLHNLHFHTIKHQLSNQQPNKAIHRPHQRQTLRNRVNKRDRKPDQHNAHRTSNHDLRRPRLENRDFRRAQQMHDKRLRQQSLQEPMRMKQLDAHFVLGALDAVVEPIDAEGADVDCAACGAEDENEADQVFDIPALGLRNVFGVHAVPGDGDLGEVVEEVLD